MPKQPWKVRIAVYIVIVLGLVLLLARSKLIFQEGVFVFNFKDRSLSAIFHSTPKSQGTYTFYVESLVSGEKYGFGEHSPMPAASLYKLYLVATVYQQIAEDKLKAADQISASKAYLTKELGSVDFGYEESPEQISYTVEEALVRVGRISDNFASIMLTDKIGKEKIKEMTEGLGAENTNFAGDEITTSAADMGEYFKALYRGEIVSPEVSEKIAKILSASVINDRIPALLPKEAGGKPLQIIHKTGELAGIRHDGGIVFLEGHPYVIVMMSKDLKYEDEGVKTLAELSKRFYDYFSSKLD